jgi:hypothetical protein
VGNADPSFQVHALDARTYILRQNKCHNFEAPFLYLLFGEHRALLLDPGRSRCLEVIPAPGHEPTHVVFYDPAARLLLRATRSTPECCSFGAGRRTAPPPPACDGLPPLTRSGSSSAPTSR